MAAPLPAPDRDLNAVGANHGRRMYIEVNTGTSLAVSQTSSPTDFPVEFWRIFPMLTARTCSLGKQVIEVFVIMPVGYVLQ